MRGARHLDFLPYARHHLAQIQDPSVRGTILQGISQFFNGFCNCRSATRSLVGGALCLFRWSKRYFALFLSKDSTKGVSNGSGNSLFCLFRVSRVDLSLKIFSSKALLNQLFDRGFVPLIDRTNLVRRQLCWLLRLWFWLTFCWDELRPLMEQSERACAPPGALGFGSSACPSAKVQRRVVKQPLVGRCTISAARDSSPWHINSP